VKVQLFVPCFIDQLYPNTAMNMVKILEKVGCSVSYNQNQTCCGQPAFNAGFWKESAAVCKKFLTDFSADSYIVSPSASCTGFVRNYYSKVLENDNMNNAIAEIKVKVFELSDFLVNVLKIEDIGAAFPHKITYHDSCAALRECNLKEEPRKLLSKVQGLQLVEMQDVETCCGFGGTFAVKFEPISVAMADQKTNHAKNTNAEYIVSTDASCLMHLDGYMRFKKMPVKTIHLADVLASGW
jgi:L-lactate dehydrogenase complex protein LldE